MLASDVLALLASGQPLPRVEVRYIDLTRGETTENFYISGGRENFCSIKEFVAAALAALLEHMDRDLTDFEIESCPAEPWMAISYDPYILPGSFLCFPAENILGFHPPTGMARRYWIGLNLSGADEGFICETNEEYVLLYWHTTG